MLDRLTVDLSPERFHVLYNLSGDGATARFEAGDICLEQRVEFPADLATLDNCRSTVS